MVTRSLSHAASQCHGDCHWRKVTATAIGGKSLSLRDNSASSLLQPLLPLAASVSAVPATEAICERLFKAGGQVLTSARLRLMGARVEAVLMTNFNSQLVDAARPRPG